MITEVMHIKLKGKIVGAVVRALASYQCGPGLISRARRHVWVEFVCLSSAPRGFSPGIPVFPSPQKLIFDLIRVNVVSVPS